MDKTTRREFLAFTVTASALLILPGCGGEGGISTKTVVELTKLQGYELEYDPDLAIGDTPFVSILKQNGKTVLEGNLIFTINGRPFYDEGSSGNKSVVSTINEGDQVTWYES